MLSLRARKDKQKTKCSGSESGCQLSTLHRDRMEQAGQSREHGPVGGLWVCRRGIEHVRSSLLLDPSSTNQFSSSGSAEPSNLKPINPQAKSPKTLHLPRPSPQSFCFQPGPMPSECRPREPPPKGCFRMALTFIQVRGLKRGCHCSPGFAWPDCFGSAPWVKFQIQDLGARGVYERLLGKQKGPL